MIHLMNHYLAAAHSIRDVKSDLPVLSHSSQPIYLLKESFPPSFRSPEIHH